MLTTDIRDVSLNYRRGCRDHAAACRPGINSSNKSLHNERFYYMVVSIEQEI